MVRRRFAPLAALCPGRGPLQADSTVIMSTTREVISCRHLLDQVRPAAAFAQGLVITTLPRGGLQIAQPLNVSEAEAKLIERALEVAKGNRTRASELLGISVRTLRNKLNGGKPESDGGGGE